MVIQETIFRDCVRLNIQHVSSPTLYYAAVVTTVELPTSSDMRLYDQLRGQPGKDHKYDTEVMQ